VAALIAREREEPWRRDEQRERRGREEEGRGMNNETVRWGGEREEETVTFPFSASISQQNRQATFQCLVQTAHVQ
jgi:hypothetical protein